jgi:penicillin-binding protein 1B
VSQRPPGLPTPARAPRPRRPSRWGFKQWAIIGIGVAAGLALTTLVIVYLSFSRMIEARLTGERERSLPNVFARPVEFRRGQDLTEQDLVARLNDLGYAQRSTVEKPGEFAIKQNEVWLAPRGGDLAAKQVKLVLPARPSTPKGVRRGIQAIEVIGDGRVDSVDIDPPLLTAFMPAGTRQKQRQVPLSSIPLRMQQAVLAIEDQSFYSHPGVNPFRLAVALIGNVMGRESSGGASTITQQLSRMFFLSDEFNAELQSGERGRSAASYLRKAREIVMSFVLERQASKAEILELYLNDVYLGQRGSFAIHGVAEAARIFFGKDVANISVAEAALIAGTIQSPASRSPFANPKRAVERRNVVLRAMQSEGFITESDADRSVREPLEVAARAVDNEAPYFVDLIGKHVDAAFPGVSARANRVDVFTTLDLNLQRAALDAVRAGLAQVDAALASRRRKAPPRAQAALVAVDPRTGEILALVGGRSYNQSQFNRAADSRRQPGSVFKPFVYLAAFEHAARTGEPDLTAASLTLDEPATFEFGGEVWEPKNYDDYDGEVTWRRALAMSRNLGTIRVGERIGFNTIAALWRKVGVGQPPRGFPSITLGVFELTPLEVAQAYTLFLNQGRVRPLRALTRIRADEQVLSPPPAREVSVSSPQSAFLVTNMMRSVINEGTAGGARGLGFVHDAAGKTGTTNELRDAWFVGFTPELLTVVWVGLDDNQPLGLTGGRAALPIWTAFMKAALAGKPSVRFDVPPGITYALIDRQSGKLAGPSCPSTFDEAFAAGTEPVELCPLDHGAAEETAALADPGAQ